MSHIFLSLLVLTVVSLHFPSSSAAGFKPSPLILPIWKDEATRLYSTSIRVGTPGTPMSMVLDSAGTWTWFNCEDTHYSSSSYRPVACGSSQCTQAGGTGCVGCFEKPRPGCTNDTCGVFPGNPFRDTSPVEGLGTDVVLVHATDGVKHTGRLRVPQLPFACTGSSMMDGLPKTSKGFLSITRAGTSFPSAVSAALKVPHKFALCLPSTAKGHGDMYIGGGPYYRRGAAQDWSKSLLVTKLLVNHVYTSGSVNWEGAASVEYFVDVRAIKVGYTPVSFKASLLDIDKKGVGGTKITTMTPYTTLHTSIYKPLVREFSKAASRKKIRSVAAVKPYGACFDAKTVGASKTGPDVPAIVLVLQSDVHWEINGANSMVKVNRDVYCLRFVDGGSRPTTSIIIGAHLLEDNLVEIDVASSTFGFSNSLLMHNTSCSRVGA